MFGASPGGSVGEAVARQGVGSRLTEPAKAAKAAGTRILHRLPNYY